ncbi:SDR family oxidoreductase [Truepera radiovictrix]|uniref:NAD-dependent epimerase/dehydratase n=1 Tax=Truepera radiovictrix (strain DSM 17093 / CIP 108686 / LMG 22925 / RQ-24) TaxID=649638 RepID=D7CVQ5_TRURR|nr:NAD(P)-dependent oxidoreductase [Truepera radiovictrix]ADI15966.1 NAD-dependent epimerase/dehydratase [Truepera radiovictrix DSM 17093]WMT58409.1 NAD(P)-dependent oxidoreductase [Truepera radiovictrix]
MTRGARILLTGGSGRLGRELQGLLDLVAPPRSELDLTRPDTIAGALRRYRPEVVVHAAAYTDVRGAESDRRRCWETNVGGTRNLVRALLAAGHPRLVHISTDYVFYGDRGHYHEDDPPGPVRNHYALSKLVAEEVARLAPHHLVIRTSFRPREWPYETAFEDVYTSQDYVDVIAPELALVLKYLHDVPYDTLHIATERKSVFELARRRRPDVRPGRKAEAGVELPDDISLDTSRWRELRLMLAAKDAL